MLLDILCNFSPTERTQLSKVIQIINTVNFIVYIFYIKLVPILWTFIYLLSDISCDSLCDVLTAHFHLYILWRGLKANVKCDTIEITKVSMYMLWITWWNRYEPTFYYSSMLFWSSILFLNVSDGRQTQQELSCYRRRWSRKNSSIRRYSSERTSRSHHHHHHYKNVSRRLILN